MSDYERGQWDMFELITSAWHGKQYYFMENEADQIVYSRETGKYMKIEKAYDEFLEMLAE